MTAHTKEEFNLFMSQLRDTNATLAFYSDFKKIVQNVKDIEISLNMLNYLLGKEDLRNAVESLWERDRRAFDVMDILIATREKDNKMFTDEKGKIHSVHSLFSSVDGIMEFLKGTGLEEVFRNSEVKDLVDYVFGVETGLDTNARKNRSGKMMETIIANIFTNADIKFESQVPSDNFKEISTALGSDKKVFDFVINKSPTKYLIETNFYNNGGSKLNEVARSYQDLYAKINGIRGYKFVWITDGIGWNSAKNKLEEAFCMIPNIYNLTNINDLINDIKRK